MKIIGGYMFNGPFTKVEDLPSTSGIYLIYTSQKWLDVGEAEDLKERISTHDRRDCWNTQSNSTAVYLLFHGEQNKEVRLAKEANLRQELKPACGKK